MITGSLCQGQPFSIAHFNTSRCPPAAAVWQVVESHEHPFSLNHFNTSKWPEDAAAEQAPSFKGHPFPFAHFMISKYPLLDATLNTLFDHGAPSCLNHLTISKLPAAAASLRVYVSHVGNPFSFAHKRTFKCPFLAAAFHVSGSQRHSLAIAHSSSSILPP